MRLQRSILGVLVNFLLGVAWAFVLIGALYTFSSFYPFGIFYALLMAFFGVLPGLFVVVLLEYLMVGMERLEEMKKQTKLIEQFTSQEQNSITK